MRVGDKVRTTVPICIGDWQGIGRIIEFVTFKDGSQAVWLEAIHPVLDGYVLMMREEIEALQ